VNECKPLPTGVPAALSSALNHEKPTLHCASLSPCAALCITSSPIASISTEGSGQTHVARHVIHRTLNPRLLSTLNHIL